MTVHRPVYLRSILTGLAAWLVSIALLHWLPLPIPIEPQFSRSMAALAVGDSVFFGLVVYALVRRRPAAERFPASAAIVLPVAFGDAIGMTFFGDFFPTVSPAASGMFAALLLLTTAVILGTGLLAGLLGEANMVRSLTTIEQEIRELSVADKETLLRVLWEELDGPADAKVEAEWLRKVERRSREIDAALVQCIPAEQVFTRLESLVKK